MKKLEKSIDIHTVKKFYYPDKNKIFYEGDHEEVLKAAIMEKLDTIDRNIIIAFLENSCSMRETAKLFNCSTTLLRTKINEITGKLRTCLQGLFVSTY